MLKGLELLLERIKKFNEISRSFRPQILEINFSHTGSNKQAVHAMQKALKMQGMLGNRQDCTMRQAGASNRTSRSAARNRSCEWTQKGLQVWSNRFGAL